MDFKNDFRYALWESNQGLLSEHQTLGSAVVAMWLKVRENHQAENLDIMEKQKRHWRKVPVEEYRLA